jgi:hypothetical protein
MKRLIAFALLVLALFTCVSCANTDNPEVDVRLGFSRYMITIPERYETKDFELAENQIAYYSKDENSVDFDIYQWKKDGLYTLAEEAAFQAQKHDQTPSDVTFNGINCKKFISFERYGGKDYIIANYMFEDETYFTKLSFWTVGTDAEFAFADKIAGTLKIMGE